MEPASIRIVLSLALSQNWSIYQLDVRMHFFTVTSLRLSIAPSHLAFSTPLFLIMFADKTRLSMSSSRTHDLGTTVCILHLDTWLCRLQVWHLLVCLSSEHSHDLLTTLHGCYYFHCFRSDCAPRPCASFSFEFAMTTSFLALLFYARPRAFPLTATVYP